MQPYRGSVPGYGYTVQEFAGLNRLLRINENEFAEMENMSLSEYPLLSTREKRTLLSREGPGADIEGFICKEAVVKIIRFNGECKLYINENEVSDFYLSADDDMCPKKIVEMGAYIVIFPDKKYVNTLDASEKGSLENKVTLIDGQTTSQLTDLIPCTIDGEAYDISKVGKEPPSELENGTVWVDTSKEKTAYKIWDESTNQWQGVSTTYIKLQSPGIGNGFKKWDAVKFHSNMPSTFRVYGSTEIISGEEKARLKRETAMLWDYCIVYDVAEDGSYLIVSGIIDRAVTMNISYVLRGCPDMDFVIESNNRLWGCKYGVVEGKTVNEIYACRQGDFKNWYAYLGVSTDSYAVSLGSDGPFTGAVNYSGYPIFFKENCLHKVYGNIPANYQLMTTVCRGVEKGMEKSIVTEGNILYYKSPVDFCAYDGSLPQGISKKLVKNDYISVVGGGLRGKVYWSVEEADGKRSILVYDAALNMWTREGGEDIRAFVRDGHMLCYEAYEDGCCCIKSINGDYDTRLIVDGESFPEEEEAVSWYFESGDIGFADVNHKHVKKLMLRVRVSEGASFRVKLSYDSKDFDETDRSYCEKGIYTVALRFPPKRCEYFRYRLEGTGPISLISAHFVFDEGSEKR